MIPINRILLIDDDPLSNMAHGKIIRDMDMFSTLSVCSSGESALELLNSCNPVGNQTDSMPDVILLDIKMPKMDGFQFMEKFDQIKGRWNHKVVMCMLTASMNTRHRIEGHSKKSIQAFLYKPLDPNELKQLLKSHYETIAP